MPYVKFFNIVLSSASMLALNNIAMASIVEGTCGRTVFQVEITEPNNISATFNLYYKTHLNQKKLFYTPLADTISVACIQTGAKNDFLLIEEFCSGSACSEEGVYAVYDPKNKKMLIKSKFIPPKDYKHKYSEYEHEDDQLRNFEHQNYEQVAKLIGYEPPYLPNHPKTFCCNRSQY